MSSNFIGEAYVGEIPPTALSMRITDRDGFDVNLNAYDAYEVRMVDPNNELVDLTGSDIADDRGTGRIAFRLPEDRSVFEQPGEYVLQLVLMVGSSVSYTSEYTIIAKTLGGRDVRYSRKN